MTVGQQAWETRGRERETIRSYGKIPRLKICMYTVSNTRSFILPEEVPQQVDFPTHLASLV